MKRVVFLSVLVGLALPAHASGGRDAVWDAEQQLTDSAYDTYTAWSGQKSVAVGPDGRIHVVWTVEDYFLSVPFQVFYKRYNPGTGWTADTCISEDQMSLGRFSRYPSAVCDSAGNLHVVWALGDSASSRNCVAYKRCIPTGAGNGGWQAAATLVSGYSASEFKYTPDLACSPNGHVHVVWARQSGASEGIHYRESTDDGNTWQSELALFDTLASGADQGSPTVAAARNNTVHVAWVGHPYFGEAYHLYYKKRINTTWFAREGVVTSSADQYEPSIATSPLTNNPHIVWRRYYGLNNYQIVYSYWDNTWQPVVSISDPSADTTQCNPQLTFTVDGAAHAVWRGWTGGAASLRQIRYAYRSPAGAWDSAVDLTAASVRTRDFPSIAARGHDVYATWQDDRGTYQQVYLRHGYAPFPDVGCTKVLMPLGAIDSGTVVVPACSLYNYDTTAHSYTVRLHIGSGYDQTTTVTNHPGLSAAYATFPSWTAGPRGTFAVRCSTELGNDGDRSNDRRTDSVAVEVHDAGVFQILAPAGAVDSGTVATPRAEVRNYGTGPETFAIRFTISDGYLDTINRTVAAGADSVFDFADWTAATTGDLVTRCSTELAGDLVPGNDAASGSVSVGVHDVGTTAIVAPAGSVDSDVVTVPQATVHNWGTGTETFDIVFATGDGYRQTITRSVAAHADSTFSFPGWQPRARGALAVKCSTELAGDFRGQNDRCEGSVFVNVRDIGVRQILAPTDTVDSGAVIYPQSVLENHGTTPATFKVRFTINPAYAESAEQFLAAGEVDTLEFNPWTAGPVGLLAMACIALPDSDMNRANDTLADSVRVVSGAGLAGGYVLPTVFRLGPAAPNPSIGTALIRYSLPRPSRLSLAVFSTDGRLVRRLADGEVPAGTWTTSWDGRDDAGRKLAGGVYYLRMRAGGFHARQVLLRLR